MSRFRVAQSVPEGFCEVEQAEHGSLVPSRLCCERYSVARIGSAGTARPVVERRSRSARQGRRSKAKSACCVVESLVQARQEVPR